MKVEVARRHIAPSEIIDEAVREWLESCKNAKSLPAIEAARSEWQEKAESA